MLKKFLLVLALVVPVGFSQTQQQISPATQINWPKIALAGTPTAQGISCTFINYGQPYQNITPNPNTTYHCGAFGWQQDATGGGGGTTTYPVTFASSGGATPGTTFDGSVARTVDAHTLGAQAAYTNLSAIGALSNAAGWLLNSGSGTFSYATPTAAGIGAEPALGNPSVSNYVLSSTSGGARSWVPQTGGGSYPGAGIASSTGSAWTTSYGIYGSGSVLLGSAPIGTAAYKAVSFFEPALGNPSTNGYVLSSTTAGVRSWVANTGSTITAVTGTSPVVATPSGSTVNISLSTGIATRILAGQNIGLNPSGGTGNVTVTGIGGNGSMSVIPAENYGAVGDWNGTTGTDNTVAIQNAINAAEAQGSTCVGLRASTYRITSALSITSSATGFCGAMIPYDPLATSGVSSIISTSASADIFDLTGTSGSPIGGLTFSYIGISRSVMPTGTATGFKMVYAHATFVQVTSVDSLDDWYQLGSASSFMNDGGGWGFNGVVYTGSPTVHCLNVDGSTGVPNNSNMMTIVGCENIATNLYTSSSGIYLHGSEIGDYFTQNIQTANVGTAIDVECTSTAPDACADIHFIGPNILDASHVSAIKVNGIPSSISGTSSLGSVSFSGAEAFCPGGTSCVDIENSSGVNILDSQIAVTGASTQDVYLNNDSGVQIGSGCHILGVTSIGVTISNSNASLIGCSLQSNGGAIGIDVTGTSTGNNLTQSNYAGTWSTGFIVNSGSGALPAALYYTGSGASVPTGPTSSTTNDCVKFSDTIATLADAGSPCGSGSGTITAVTATSPVVSSGGTTPAISMPAATTLVDGYLSHIDWATFMAKQANLNLLPGTYADGYLCSYTSSGTLINCNSIAASNVPLLNAAVNTFISPITSSASLMKWLAPSLPTGGLVGLELGVAESTNNAFGFNFFYAGSGSTSNYVGFGFYGSGTMLLYPNAVKIGNGSIALYLCSGGTFDGLFASASAKCTGGSGTATMLTLQ